MWCVIGIEDGDELGSAVSKGLVDIAGLRSMVVRSAEVLDTK